MAKTDVALLRKHAFVGVEVEGRLRGIKTLFIPGDVIVDCEILRQFIVQQGIGHVYIGAHGKSVNWRDQKVADRICVYVLVLHNVFFTIEQDVDHVTVYEMIPQLVAMHERVRMVYTSHLLGPLVTVLKDGDEIKIVNPYTAKILTVQQTVDVRYTNDGLVTDV